MITNLRAVIFNEKDLEVNDKTNIDNLDTVLFKGSSSKEMLNHEIAIVQIGGKSRIVKNRYGRHDLDRNRWDGFSNDELHWIVNAFFFEQSHGMHKDSGPPTDLAVSAHEEITKRKLYEREKESSLQQVSEPCAST